MAQVGDVISFMDAVSPPYLLSAEWTAHEMEWYQGEYVSREEIAQAFQMPLDKVPYPRGQDGRSVGGQADAGRRCILKLLKQGSHALHPQRGQVDRKSTRLNSSHSQQSRMPSSA